MIVMVYVLSFFHIFFKKNTISQEKVVILRQIFTIQAFLLLK